MTRSTDLSPKPKKLYKKTLTLTATVRAMKRRRVISKNKHRIFKEQLVENSTYSLKEHVRRFIRSQIELVGKSPRGRRFTMEDKILGIILHKQSNKTYKILQKLFCLPTSKTLNALLKRMGIRAGINKSIFKSMESVANDLKNYEKVCVLLFDEIHLQPHISINSSLEFEGLEDTGKSKCKHIANTAQVHIYVERNSI